MSRIFSIALVMFSFAHLQAMQLANPEQSNTACHSSPLNAEEVANIAGDMDMHLLHINILNWKRRAKGCEELLKDITPMYRPQGSNPLNYYFEAMKLWHQVCKKWNFDTSQVVIAEGCIAKHEETELKELYKNN